MAIPVDRIPSLWEPFQDGRIWRFTEDYIADQEHLLALIQDQK